MADSSDGRGRGGGAAELPGESCPGCSYLLSAWARPGNVRKINNKYLGNEARDGVGGAGRQRAERGMDRSWPWLKDAFAAAEPGSFAGSRRRIAGTRSVLRHMSVRVPACQQRPRQFLKAGAWLSALGHAGAPMGTSRCFIGVTVSSLSSQAR